MSENPSPAFGEEMKKIKNRDSIKHRTNELADEGGTGSRTALRQPSQKRSGEGETGSLGLADTHHCIENG